MQKNNNIKIPTIYETDGGLEDFLEKSVQAHLTRCC